jgi:peptidylprolyl isomerase
MAFYAKPEPRIPIKTLRLAADLPAAERTLLEVFRSDTPACRDPVEPRRNRREKWCQFPAGRMLAMCPCP